MEFELEKEYYDYLNKYFGEIRFSWAVAANRGKHLMKQLHELKNVRCKGVPAFKAVKSYEIVKCGKIWVIIGKIICDSVDSSQTEKNYELAIGINKYELGIWWDLNAPK